ncbi:MAG: shikimate dehydrogenase [Myxococcota bacterium]
MSASATVRCGIVLHPSAHTLSPRLHREAYAELELEARYETFDVTPAQLPETLRRLGEQGLRQLSVSLPHKEAVLELADRATPEARAIGAANTLTREHGEWVADNTDWIGVARSLEPHGPWEGRRALILGAGGAARAIVYALEHLDCQVCVTNRSPERARRLVAELGGRVGAVDDPWDLLVNATPVGMFPDVDATPFPAESLRPGGLVFDSVYRPLQTRLLREARAAGCAIQDGLEMLVHQAAEQVRIWSGWTPTAARLREAALRELR